MSTIVTRAGKGSPLTHNEVDANFNNLNNDKVEESTTITAGTGLSGGGDLSANRTISLANTAVTPGSYGSASAVGTFTVDAQGRLTAASNTNIAIANTAVSGLGTMSTQNANNVAITGGSVNGTTIGGSTAAAGTFTSLTNSGNLTFSSTGQRITGDMTNATLSNRLMFQNSVTNANTPVNAIPNGTGINAGFRGYGASDPTNAPAVSVFQVGTTDSRISSEINGTASYTPMTFYTGGSERMRLTTAGDVGIATSSPGERLTVGGNVYANTGNFIANRGNAQANTAGSGLALQIDGTTYAAIRQPAAEVVAFYRGNGGTTETMRIAADGSVGIGTASPQRKLSIVSSSADSQFTVGNTAPSMSLTNDASSPNTASKTFVMALATTAGNYGLNDGEFLLGGVGNSRGNIVINANYSGTGTKNVILQPSSGDVGIGTASPDQRVTINSANTSTNSLVSFKQAGTTYAYVGMGSDNKLRLEAVSTDVGIQADSANVIFFNTNGSERMRITSGGEVYIAGTTDQGAYNLQCNGTGVWGAGAYVNGSDARLKDNIQSLDSGLDVIKAMRPVTFQYKQEYSKDQSVQPGFIAQELQEAMAGKPYLEGVVQEGPNHLNVAYQNIIPILVKAMQEQQDQIKALQDKIAALEAK